MRASTLKETRKMLAGDWDLWVTVTTRGIISGERLLNSWKHFLKCLNREEKIPFYVRYLSCWVFIEKGETGEGCHLHALLKGLHSQYAERLHRTVEREFGISKVEEYIPKGGAIDYLACKVLSPNLHDFVFIKITSRVDVLSKLPKTYSLDGEVLARRTYDGRYTIRL